MIGMSNPHLAHPAEKRARSRPGELNARSVAVETFLAVEDRTLAHTGMPQAEHRAMASEPANDRPPRAASPYEKSANL